MPDAEWVNNIRKIVMQAVAEASPCDVAAGTVLSVSPLTVQVDQKLILRENQLTLTRQVTDHTEQMIIPGIGSVQVTVQNGLKIGEKVEMVQQNGGQHYVIVGRI